ncbi:hypothetical protein [Vagococcus silagei]|uniref:Uncharacterized protein n=1 Tax=Vagococcus silagei TaxID=2508885 RepID=A0A4S3AZT6_9ENTE|nr:hypothetical protein [Vagococcus silagei]THB60324.1 hypothetical protein ESZ54_10765 [Vagococcus silagei]
MKEFLETLPVNHWVSITMLIVCLLTFIYSVSFYFSKEGRDERGRSVFAKASMLTFVSTIIIFILFSAYSDLFVISSKSASFLVHLGLALVTTIQFTGIVLFNKFS